MLLKWASAEAGSVGWLPRLDEVVIDPAVRQVVVRRRNAPTQVLGERDVFSVPELFPGWEVAVAGLFA